MKNFVRFNIDNVKGTKRAISIQKQESKVSTGKTRALSKPYHQPSINNRLSLMEEKLENLEQVHQEEILEQLNSIRKDIRLIKSHIFESKSHIFESKSLVDDKQNTHESLNEEDEETIYNNNQKMKSQGSEQEYKHTFKHPHKKIMPLEEYIAKHKKHHQRNAITLKTIYPMLKEYKLEGPDFGNIFYGYTKKNSHPIVVKYAEEGLISVIEVYDKLWKNIAMAKWPCINKIIDFKRDDSTVLIMQKNKSSIIGLPYKTLLLDILRILEFIHDCGYLYRNIEPEHFMLNEDGQLVVIDFRRAKRYIDIKGHQVEVIDSYNGSPFASNNQVRGHPESKKDDLESLGYLALLLMEYEIPWMGLNKDQTIKIRSSITLQELYKHQTKWIQFMATVMKTPRNERPDYKRLLDILETI